MQAVGSTQLLPTYQSNPTGQQAQKTRGHKASWCVPVMPQGVVAKIERSERKEKLLHSTHHLPAQQLSNTKEGQQSPPLKLPTVGN